MEEQLAIKEKALALIEADLQKVSYRRFTAVLPPLMYRSGLL